MHRATLEVLACPSCRGRYDCVVHAGSAERIERGFLRCECRVAVIPVVDGFAMFTEALLHEGMATPEALEEMSSRLFGAAVDFASYLDDKQDRGVIEAYAAFQPFSESMRAVDPLLGHLRKPLRPGGFVLDVWCRTGWSGEWLAGTLPEQRIIAVWQGDSSVLGYRGFRRLLGTDKRAANLDIIFSHPERPFPFRDRVCDLLFSHDALHRFNIVPHAQECLRVTRDDGAMVFAHVHLSNSRPEPFFERGCTQLHGREYRTWLDGLAARSARRGFVLGEASTFRKREVSNLIDECCTPDYNGLLLLVPPGAPAQQSGSAGDHWRYLVNPMFRFDLSRGSARPAAQLHGGVIEELLRRHPVYQACLPATDVSLGEHELIALLLAAAGADRRTLLSATGEAARMSEALARLAAAEVLRPAPVSLGGHELQRVHANQHLRSSCEVAADVFAHVLKYPRGVISLDDGSVLDGGELRAFAAHLGAHLRAHAIGPGNAVAVAAATPLLWITAVAAANAGIDVRIVPADVAPDPSARLWICEDCGSPRMGWLQIGLDGRPDGLISALAAQPCHEPVQHRPAGRIEVMLDSGVARLPVDLIAAGCAALKTQRASQLQFLTGQPLHDLLCVLVSLIDGERIQTG